MYPEQLVVPYRTELTEIGIKEILTPEQADTLLSKKQGTVLVYVNSMCGCAMASSRPAVKLAAQHGTLPDLLTTVFAGQDMDATAKVREYLSPLPPSSPSFYLFKDGKVVFSLPRERILKRMPEDIASELTAAFDTYCRN